MSHDIRTVYSIISSEIFLIRGLTVSSELIGSTHGFLYEGCKVEITLPDISEVKEGYMEGAKASKAGIFQEHSDACDIHEINIKVDKSQDLPVDPQSFDHKPVARDLYSESERKIFDKVCNEYRSIAISAYEYWLTILRWVTDDFRIGRDERLGFDSHRSTTLKEKENNRTVWKPTLCYTVESESVIGSTEWNHVQVRLDKMESPPVYITLKHDAEENLHHGDYKVSIIELAMACEIFLRMCVLKRLPNELAENLVKAIEELNINQYKSKHFKKIVLPEYESEYRKIANELDSLFSKRNAIVHTGDYQGVTKANCERFVAVAESLFLFHEKIQNV